VVGAKYGAALDQRETAAARHPVGQESCLMPRNGALAEPAKVGTGTGWPWDEARGRGAAADRANSGSRGSLRSFCALVSRPTSSGVAFGLAPGAQLVPWLQITQGRVPSGANAIIRAIGAPLGCGRRAAHDYPDNYGREAAMNLHLSVGPLMALIAGVLILIMPRLLNFIVAIYLIVIGLIGIFGTSGLHI
jgi:hypothetical protein